MLTWLRRVLGGEPSAPAEAPLKIHSTAGSSDEGEAAETGEATANVPHVRDLHRHPNGSVLSLSLEVDAWIQGVPCRAGFIHFLANGSLSSAVLALDHAFEEELLPADTRVELDQDGTLRAWHQTLHDDREFSVWRGSASQGSLPLVVPAGSTVEVEATQLRSLHLSTSANFGGMDLPAGTELVFGESGELSHVTPSEVLQHLNVRWQPYETILFLDGEFLQGLPETSGELHGIPYIAGEPMVFHRNGRMAECTLSRDHTVSEVPCAEATVISFDEDGNLIQGTLAADLVLQGFSLRRGEAFKLDSKGALRSFVPDGEAQVGPWQCAAGQRIELFEDGALLRGHLATEHEVEGYRAGEGAQLWRAETGAPTLLVGTNLQTPGGETLEGCWSVLFGEDGQLYQLPTTERSRPGALHLRERSRVAEYWCAPDSSVQLYPDLRVQTCVLAEDQAVAGLEARAKTEVHLREDGSPSNFTLAETTTIDGLVCAPGRTLSSVTNNVIERYAETTSLHSAGTLSTALLAEDTTYRRLPLRGGACVGLAPCGRILFATLAADWEHPSGPTAKRGTLIALHEDESPRQLTLATAITLDDIVYNKDDTLTFSAEGDVERVVPSRVPLGAITPVP